MIRRFLMAFSLAFLTLSPLQAFAAAIDYQNSSVSVDRAEAEADGIDNVTVSVTLRDINLGPATGMKVELISSRGSEDEIHVLSDMTDLFGRAKFRIFSLKQGGSIYTARVNGQELVRKASVSWSGGLAIAINPGDLIKIPDDGDPITQSDTAVYYYSKSGRRFVFPNEKTYFTWYQDFSDIKIIPLDQMSLVPIGGNVTIRPGTRMLKFQTDVKTYAVSRGGTLRWMKTEEVAKGIYGPNWNTFIDDIPESFYVNYTFGEPVPTALDFVPDIVRNSVPTIDVDKGIE